MNTFQDYRSYARVLLCILMLENTFQMLLDRNSLFPFLNLRMCVLAPQLHLVFQYGLNVQLISDTQFAQRFR